MAISHTSCSSSVSVANTKFLLLTDLTFTVPAVPSTSPAPPLVRPANLLSVSLSRTRKEPRTACCFCAALTLFEIRNGELFFSSTVVFLAVIMVSLRTAPLATLELSTAGDRGAGLLAVASWNRSHVRTLL